MGFNLKNYININNVFKKKINISLIYFIVINIMTNFLRNTGLFKNKDKIP